MVVNVTKIFQKMRNKTCEYRKNIAEWDKTLYNYKKYKKQIIFKLDIFDLKIWVSEKNVWFEWKKTTFERTFSE